MKILLIALFVAVGVKAYPGWSSYGNNMGNNNGQRLPWINPQQQNQNNGFGPDVEWMIIAADNTQQHPGRRPWQWQNVPPGHNHHHQHGNSWTQPIIIVEQRPDGTQSPSETPGTSNNDNNNDNQPQSTPRYHGGEGQIDIRFGD